MRGNLPVGYEIVKHIVRNYDDRGNVAAGGCDDGDDDNGVNKQTITNK